jgi:hypothetical protein
LQQIFVGRQKTRRRRFDFEKTGVEVARFRVEPDGGRSVTLSIDPVTGGAVLVVDDFGWLQICRDGVGAGKGRGCSAMREASKAKGNRPCQRGFELARIELVR